MNHNTHTPKPILLAIAGGSASGKTTFARDMAREIGEDKAAVLELDSYYKDLSGLSAEERMKVNFDHPDALDLALFKEHLAALQQGQPIEKPVYDYGTHARKPAFERFDPKPVVIIEGLFALLDDLCPYYDYRVFIDTPDDLRIARRILRDVRERGRDVESIIEQYLATVRPMHKRYVSPTVKNSDLVVDGEKGLALATDEILSFVRKGLGFMKILVIGSEGFIGGYLTRALLNSGHQVTGLDIGRADEPREGYECVKGDLMDSQALRTAAHGVDMVINLAAKHHDFGVSREEFFQINETGTQRILDVLSELGIRKFIFFSSVAVYGDSDQCSHEECPRNPSNDYGESKLAAEELIEAWAKDDPQRAVLIVRPTVVYGPHNYANMFRLIDTIYKRRFFLVGKGDNIKSVTYVENLVAATMFLLEKISPGLAAYNYSDYPHHASAQLVRYITDGLGRKPYTWHLPLKPILCVTSLVDVLARITGINFPITANRIKKINMMTWHGSDKIRQMGFEQTVSIEEGLKRMIHWYLERKSKQK